MGFFDCGRAEKAKVGGKNKRSTVCHVKLMAYMYGISTRTFLFPGPFEPDFEYIQYTQISFVGDFIYYSYWDLATTCFNINTASLHQPFTFTPPPTPSQFIAVLHLLLCLRRPFHLVLPFLSRPGPIPLIPLVFVCSNQGNIGNPHPRSLCLKWI